MIFTNVSITVRDGKSTQDDYIYLYRGDRNIEVRFTILETPFRYTDAENLIELSDAYFAQLVINPPNNRPPIFSDIDPTEYNIAKFLITEEMIDELEEVGEYDYQIILYDENVHSKVTIPPIVGGIKLLEPISIEPEEKVNRSRVGYAKAAFSEELEAFDENGNYNKTEWKNGDLITDGKLNKIENALDKINENTSNFSEEIERISNTVSEEIEGISNTVEEEIERISNTVSEEIEGISNTVEEVSNRIEEVSNEISEEIENTTNRIDEVSGELSKELEDISSRIDEVEEGIFGDIENGLIFETDKLTINSLGGISSGTDLNGLNVKDILDKLLYPYVKPSVSVSTTPSSGTHEHGDYKTITNIRVTITKKTEKITLLRILDGSNVIYSKTDSIENGGTFDISCNISTKDNKRLTIEVTDAADSIVTTSTNIFNYLYPYYYGVANENTTLNNTFIKTLTKKVEAKGEKTLSFITNNQRMIFAYPTAYGKLSKILDINSFNVTGTFTVTTVNLIALDGTTQPYYVYANNPSTVENFTMKFSY